MIKVLILDDEPVIIKGLKKLIKWQEFDMNIIGEATDGNTGLDMIISLKPDVVLSDICMPGKTGLDLLKYISNNKLNTKVIFLSGYQEFSYAKDAITYGAVDYILKPIKKSNLEEALYKVTNLLNNQDKTQNISSSSDEKRYKNIIEAIVSGKPVEGSARDLFIKSNIEDSNGLYSIFSIKLNTRDNVNTFTNDENELMTFSAFNLIERHIEENNCGTTIARNREILSCAFITKKVDEKDKFYQVAEEVITLVRRELNLDTVIGVGKTVSNIAQFSESYETSIKALEYSFFNKNDILVYGHMDQPLAHVSGELNVEYKTLIKSVLSKDSINTICERVDRILEIIKYRYYGNKDLCLSKCSNILEDIYNELKSVQLVSDELIERKTKFINTLENFKNYDSLCKGIIEHIEQLLNNLYADVKSRDSFEIMKVKEYIKHHYSENITLEQMAKIACMNQYYFSTFFKKVTGQNFKNYLTEVRMKEALRILLSSDYKTYELAEMVGYGDSRHFSDVFKDFYGKNPMDYKKHFKSH